MPRKRSATVAPEAAAPVPTYFVYQTRGGDIVIAMLFEPLPEEACVEGHTVLLEFEGNGALMVATRPEDSYDVDLSWIHGEFTSFTTAYLYARGLLAEWNRVLVAA